MTKTQAAAQLVDAALAATRRNYMTDADLRRVAEVKALIAAPDEMRRQVALVLAALGARPTTQKEHASAYRARQLLAIALRKRVGLTAEQAIEVLQRVREAGEREIARGELAWASVQTLKPFARQIEHAFDGWSPSDRARVEPLIVAAVEATQNAPEATRLRGLVHETGGSPPLEILSDEDNVGPALREVFDQSNESLPTLTAMLELLASYPQSGKPSKTWLAAADKVRDSLGDAPGLVGSLLDVALTAEDVVKEHRWGGDDYTHVYFVAGGHEQVLCAIATLAGRLGEQAPLDRLRRLSAKAVSVIGGEFGNPRSLRLANVCAHSIAQAGTASSITELLALERQVRHGTLLREIRKAIDRLAEVQGLTRGELLERGVERHGLNDHRALEVPLSRGAARVEVDGTRVALVYVGEDGTAKKSVPADLRDETAELRAEMKGIRKTISGERVRLDGLLAEARSWPVKEWRSLYLDHPITGALARRLIWRFGTDLVGIPTGDRVMQVGGDTVELPEDGDVRLWHPIDAPPEEVHAWRSHLFERELTQPLKQAFREVYVLTPAEAETRVYSNRFAAHVFRQVQARALMKGRGWSPVALAWWDDGIDHGVARKVFEPFKVRAEFFYDPIVDVEPAGDLYPYVTSDQVRFYAAERDEELALADVPRLVFTEAMRDVDLFVGVTSIGADPEWLDRGEGRRFERYWHDWGFGDLSEAAKIRRDVLAELMPRLAIADRAQLEGRFLTVRGDLRTYRIHLGSGNILMSPNDEYLCIVAARSSAAQKLYLPFDDDPVLSLILSKAFMLANDTGITDSTIMRQIRSGE
jgi:hypothetical protein